MIYVEPYEESQIEFLKTITVYVKEDYSWQLELPSSTKLHSITTDLGNAQDFVDLNRESLNFEISGEVLTSNYIGEYLIKIQSTNSDGVILKQEQIIMVQDVDVSKYDLS